MNGYTLGRLLEQAKWPTGAPIRLPLEFCIFAKRLFYGKPHVITQATAALSRSVGLLGQFITVWKNRTGHRHIPNYCNSAAHARRGLMNIIDTSECKALWGEPEEVPFSSICTHTYVTAAGGPVCHLHALQLVSPIV